jgi:hypothetical protein
MRREIVSFRERKKVARRIRLRYTEPMTPRAKRFSFQEVKKSRRRTRVTYIA